MIEYMTPSSSDENGNFVSGGTTSFEMYDGTDDDGGVVAIGTVYNRADDKYIKFIGYNDGKIEIENGKISDLKPLGAARPEWL